MKRRTLVLIVAFALPMVTSSYAHADKPPVEVEIIVDGDDDFFGNKKKTKEPPESKSDTERNADEMFEELEKTERVRVKRAEGEGSNVNTNTQVVKVLVIGGKSASESQAEANPRVETKTTARATAQPPPVPAPPAVAPPPRRTDRRQRARDQRAEAPRERRWWHRDPRPGAGDFMLFLGGSTWERGAMLGLGGELLVTDVLGLRVEGWLDAFDRETIRDTEDRKGLFLSDDWARDGRGLGDVDTGVVHRLTAQVAFHIIPGKAFDLAPSIGVSHFGYVLDSIDDDTEVGGAGFLSAGLSAAYHIKRIFIGIDVGWHPYRLFAYSDTPRATDDTIINEDEATDDGERVVEEPFDAARFTFTGHVGVRF